MCVWKPVRTLTKDLLHVVVSFYIFTFCGVIQNLGLQLINAIDLNRLFVSLFEKKKKIIIFLVGVGFESLRAELGV